MSVRQGFKSAARQCGVARRRKTGGHTQAILMIDKQHRYLFAPKRKSIGGEAIVARFQRFVALARAAREHLIWVGFEPKSNSPYAKLSPTFGKGSHWRFSFCGAAPKADEIVCGKTARSAFANPHLHDYLTEQGIRKLVFVGGYDDACLKASVTDALKFGYDCTILYDQVFTRSFWHNLLGGLLLKQKVKQRFQKTPEGGKIRLISSAQFFHHLPAKTRATGDIHKAWKQAATPPAADTQAAATMIRALAREIRAGRP